MSENNEFLNRASALGAEVHQEILRERTRELQKYLMITSVLVVLVSMGMYSVEEIIVGPVTLVAQKSGWISLFAMINLAYFLALYLAACWSDITRHGFKAWYSLSSMKLLVSSAHADHLDVGRLFSEIVEIAEEHRRFLESKGIEADGSEFQERSKWLKEELLARLELGLAKNRVLKEIATGSVWNRRLTLLLEVIVPVLSGLVALALLWSTAQWQW